MRTRFPLLILALGALACSGASAPPRDDVAVVVGMVTIDPMSKTPVVILEEQRGGRRLPIWIGVNEARAIAQRLEDVTPQRPNTHDLAKRLVEGLDGAVERVTVTELRESTYYAVIALRVGEARIDVVEVDLIAQAWVEVRLESNPGGRQVPYETTPFLVEDLGGPQHTERM